ncbi:MAG TPA: VOC family protein [Myxococcaceae bacterium]|nr:VOC family protein [Myxococcaceae bacterium]
MNRNLDHLVLAAEALEAGSPPVERVLGVRLAAGGQHARMGTHNRLLRLGERAYLEVIAIDPEGSPPPHRRWFGLDDPGTRTRLDDGPQLVHWVAAVETTELPELPFDVGRWEQFQRGDLSWQLTVRSDGALPGDGVVPSLICWGGAAHPAARLPDAGVTLQHLELEHPRATDVQRQLDLLGLPYRCSASGVPRITVHLRTPAGTRTLHSTGPIR